MSRANVELVKRIYEAFAAGGAEAIVPYFPSDVVFIAFPEWLEQSEFPGHDGVRAITAVWTESFDDFGFEVSDIRETGDGVVMLGETVGQIKDSGVPIRQPLGMVYSDFRDDGPGRVCSFLTWREALEAAGLEP